MTLNKGFNCGSVSWQLKDHYQSEYDRLEREFEPYWISIKDFMKMCEEGANYADN